MQVHFKHLCSKSFLMIQGTLQSNEFWPLKLISADSGVHWDSNSQNGSSLGSVRVHSFTLSCIPRSMKCDSQARSWPTPLQTLALVVNPRLGLRQVGGRRSWTHLRCVWNGIGLELLSIIAPNKKGQSFGKKMDALIKWQVFSLSNTLLVW
jgi:hypothetical protein